MGKPTLDTWEIILVWSSRMSAALPLSSGRGAQHCATAGRPCEGFAFVGAVPTLTIGGFRPLGRRASWPAPRRVRLQPQPLRPVSENPNGFQVSKSGNLI